jgi:K+-sensing histidine kinase KdpD
MDPTARAQTGCPPDASLEACEPRVRPILEDTGSRPSNMVMLRVSANGADDADAIRPVDPSSDAPSPEDADSTTLRASLDVRGHLNIVRLWIEEKAQQTEALRRDAAFAEIVRPIYRAFAHDARNPIAASQLQLGILRELDTETLEERRASIANTLERHMESMNTGISLLIGEFAPDSGAPPVDVLAVINRVRRLVLPYARNQSATVKARTGSADLYTSAPEEDLKRALLGYLARLLPHADPGNRIEIRVDRSDSTEPVVLLTAEGLSATDDLARSTVKALERDAQHCGARVETDPSEDNTTVRLILPGE